MKMNAEICRVPRDVAELLDYEAARINNIGFVDSDPVQFPRRFSRIQDIEISGLLSAMVAWGNRKMICRDVERMLSLMNHDPYAYVLDEGYEDLDDGMNLHRTFFARHFKYFLRGMNEVYRRYGSLDAFSASVGAGSDEFPSWKLVGELQKVMCDVNGGAVCSQCLPVNLGQTALKRINMALRWFVRDDGIVDMGCWRSIPKSKLYIPLDVHVGNVSRELGLLDRKANDRKSVEQLTAVLRTLRPDDPAVYDFALFGIGVSGRMRDSGNDSVVIGR